MEVLDFGTKTYQETWDLQKELIEKRAQGLVPDTLILVEHSPVYTVGRAGTSFSTDDAPQAPGEIKVRRLGSVPMVEVERGGKVTFHGPGQLVGYPIFDLVHHDLRMYLRDMERILMATLVDETMLPARPCPDSLVLEPGQLQTGVWIRDKKIASIGIAVKKWISYHGFALNLTTDLRYFEAVEPCGFHGNVMTTVERELGSDADMKKVSANIKRRLAERFGELSAHYTQIKKAAEAQSSAASSQLETPTAPLTQ